MTFFPKLIGGMLAIIVGFHIAVAIVQTILAAIPWYMWTLIIIASAVLVSGFIYVKFFRPSPPQRHNHYHWFP